MLDTGDLGARRYSASATISIFHETRRDRAAIDGISQVQSLVYREPLTKPTYQDTISTCYWA